MSYFKKAKQITDFLSAEYGKHNTISLKKIKCVQKSDSEYKDS